LSLLVRRRPQRTVLAFTGLGFIFTSPRWLARALRPVVTCVLAAVARRSTHWILLQNDDDRALLAAAGIGHAARMQVIAGSGIELAAFPRQPLPPAHAAIVLLPARVLRDKGVAEFVAAARCVRATRPDVRFVIAGERDAANPGAVALADLTRWQNEGVIEWWQHCTDMAGVYARARIVCLPSYREGLPKVLLEGASCARPLVATNVPGCREVCRDGESGILVPLGDVAALSAAIHALLDDDALAERLAHGARARVERVFALPVIARATIVWYRAILAT
jgi:glycosyltransferase involved in cell wall biosynthesis